MTAGQNESVSGDPIGTSRIEVHELIPENESQISEAHRCPGMTRVCSLNRIGREKPDGVCDFGPKKWSESHLAAL